MAKDPAMLWYPGDWIAGTQGMTFEEKGAYMELLMFQFNNGHMADHMVGRMVGQLWGQIKHKFKVDENGLWYNERVDLEKEKRKSFTNSRKNNLKGKNQYSKSGHTTSRMENENKNEDEIKNKEGGTGEGIFLSNPESFPNWSDEVKKFMTDDKMKLKYSDDYKIPFIQVEETMQKFISGLTLKEDYKDIAALKKHFYYHFEKHYKSRIVNQNGNNNLSKGFIEVPDPSDYDKMETW